MNPIEPDKRLENEEEMLNALRSALRPEPLSGALIDRIRRDWDLRSRGARRLRLSRAAWLGLAAAAGLTVTLLIPTTRPMAEQTVLATKLTETDAAAIVQALAVMEWEGAVEYTIDLADASLSALLGTVSSDASRNGEYSWFAGDDWDAPPS